jgi:predicted acyl esterase
VEAGRKNPAIVEFLLYRRRDGTMATDSQMHPWFAYNDYLSFRIDIQSKGDSEGSSPASTPTRNSCTVHK